MKRNKMGGVVVEVAFLENGKIKRFFWDKKKKYFYWNRGNKK